MSPPSRKGLLEYILSLRITQPILAAPPLSVELNESCVPMWPSEAIDKNGLILNQIFQE